MAEDYSYIGVGKVYLKEVDGDGGHIEVGNCSALNFSVTEDVKELKDFTQPGGGTYNEVRRISAVEMSLSMHDLSPENLARALYGDASAVAEAAVTDEELVGYQGAFAPFANIPKDSPAPVIEAAEGADADARDNTTAYGLGDYVVPATPNGYFYKATAAGTSAGAPPTFLTVVGGTTVDGTVTWTNMGKVLLVADTDYTLENGGIAVAADASFTDGEVLRFGYTKVASNVVQALIESGKEYDLFFDGLNEARSGKSTTVNAFRVKIGAAQNVSLIGDEFAVLEVTGKLLKDTTKNGTTVSQYFKVAIEA